MTTKHKLRATIPHGPADIGAEVDCEITFTYLPGAPEQGPSYASGGQPAEPGEIDFVSVLPIRGGKPTPYDGVFRDLEQANLDDLARDWLESDEGYGLAHAAAEDDEEYAREYAAALRRADAIDRAVSDMMGHDPSAVKRCMGDGK